MKFMSVSSPSKIIKNREPPSIKQDYLKSKRKRRLNILRPGIRLDFSKDLLSEALNKSNKSKEQG